MPRAESSPRAGTSRSCQQGPLAAQLKQPHQPTAAAATSRCCYGQSALVGRKCSLGLLLAVLVLLGAASLRPAAAQAVPANPLPCACTDVDVRESFTTLVNYTCWEQFQFGKCAEPFMLDAIKEVPEGYCEISCGRCNCCGSLSAVAAGAGLSEFLWALNLTDPVGRGLRLDGPGFAATVFAPDNAAMAGLFARMGGKAAIQADAGLRGKLGVIVAYHVAKPLPGFEAWTSPFLSPGATLQTFHPSGAALSIASGGDGGVIRVVGGQGGADITQKDVYACKGYIQVINSFLVPPGEQLKA